MAITGAGDRYGCVAIAGRSSNKAVQAARRILIVESSIRLWGLSVAASEQRTARLIHAADLARVAKRANDLKHLVELLLELPSRRAREAARFFQGYIAITQGNRRHAQAIFQYLKEEAGPHFGARAEITLAILKMSGDIGEKHSNELVSPERLAQVVDRLINEDEDRAIDMAWLFAVFINAARELRETADRSTAIRIEGTCLTGLEFCYLDTRAYGEGRQRFVERFEADEAVEAMTVHRSAFPSKTEKKTRQARMIDLIATLAVASEDVLDKVAALFKQDLLRNGNYARLFAVLDKVAALFKQDTVESEGPYTEPSSDGPLKRKKTHSS